MSSSFLDPRASVTAGTKHKQIQAAKEMQQAVLERAQRTGKEPPPYEFLELIGKGSFGRVFKSKNRNTGELVAVKITEIDRSDYEEQDLGSRDDTFKSFLKEVTILQQLKDSKAHNVNIIHEAFSLHSQLWLVCEWVAGGSVHTLMKASPRGLEEHFIIPIARELAVALKHIHDAGIIHRDLKCANVLVAEDGRVNLCDFGISGVLESQVAKRSTIIGTPNWMPPELLLQMGQAAATGYGAEVDCWAYGCTIYEMATGMPPNARIAPAMMATMRAPRLEGGDYSDELRDFVSYCLEERPKDRPRMEDILNHPFLANTSKSHPTESLRRLVERYRSWELSGGQRMSLFNPYGAQAPDPLAPQAEFDDEWNFSTTDEFEKRFSMHSSRLSDPFEEKFQFPANAAPVTAMKDLTPFEKAMEEERIRRGGRAMEKLFNPNAAPYGYDLGDSSRPLSDLPLRNIENDRSSQRLTMIDLDEAGAGFTEVPSLDLSEISTLRASRANRFLKDSDDEDEEEQNQREQLTRRATRDWTFPKPAAASQSNRRTRDWTFSSALAEANSQDSGLPAGQIARRRATKELTLPMLAVPSADNPNRRTMEWTFSTARPAGGQENVVPAQEPPLKPRPFPSPALAPPFRPQLRHAATEPLDAFLPEPLSAAPESPNRTSMIDLDFADPTVYTTTYPGQTITVSTIPSAVPSPSTPRSVQTTSTSGHPFDLEDQVQLSRNSNRASFHMKSQSEPVHELPGLLTPAEIIDPDSWNSDQDTLHSRAISQSTVGSATSIPATNRRVPRRRHWENFSQDFSRPIAPVAAAAQVADDSDHYFSESNYDTDDNNNNYANRTRQPHHQHHQQQRRRLATHRPLKTSIPILSAPPPMAYPDTESDTEPTIRSITTATQRVDRQRRPVIALPTPRAPEPRILRWHAERRLVGREKRRTGREFGAAVRRTSELLRGLRARKPPVKRARGGTNGSAVGGGRDPGGGV
ncbi:STE/STE20/YSK protein kinase [Coniosporium apollinis CBS 100218]|uniref:non-specific serine/threonine protein kinase n=1 Tax=Coniosporium apollinis (strain CBS 100218) TaxID=1168221 RepID=R7YQM5_CONA1|nr:STE/STE20/YSK protein kinase [Coniosporium apollinis CBS 100218]EON64207.1 STE/STE20/YSK protein kinase [Coniosporium apollinis CBS 100218]